MRNKKRRCMSCLMYYSDALNKCPSCGCAADAEFSQPYCEALPLCSIVEDIRIGRAIKIDKNSITYIGLNMPHNKRILVKEYYLHGYVKRFPSGEVMPTESYYESIVRENKQNFINRQKNVIEKNGTVYVCLSIPMGGIHYSDDEIGRKSLNDEFYKRSDVVDVVGKTEQVLEATETGSKKIRSDRRYNKKELLEKRKASCNISCRSIIGKRSNQEDAADLRVFDDGIFAVLCDGMGGMNSGEIASGECVRLMLEAADTVMYCDESIIPNVLKSRSEEADRYISSLQDMEGNRLKCGTTLLCVAVRNNNLYFVSVGDSHIYLARNNRNNAIRLLTEEHNYFADLMEQVKNGEIDYEDAVNHPKREALTSYVGKGGISKINISTSPVTLCDGDSVLLCSDGLYRAIDDEEIFFIINNEKSAQFASDRLIDTVKKYNFPNQDNTTLILYKHCSTKEK